ncbi:RHS repeat-associated core domain-containing protein [Pseudomonas sp. FW300-N1A1]|uniref:RHS repeat-associated core domain-containing protein n=1 Tax=Pseudomonas sp. FW300-N1A1 TaxID=2075555 RepID=UPI0021145C6C|nr:RHS repeat-associated core domain-containing protein [Pseudomonas sp. FW300-N1A1]
MQPHRQTLLCRYHYDAKDRLVDCTPTAQPSSQRFYLKDRLATEIQGVLQRSIMQHEDQLLAQQQRQNGTQETRLLATDQQRSVLAILDATRPHHLAYTPYGYRTPENGLLSLLGFNGERPDPVTGHYLLGNGYRAFNPVLMRFNSPDSWSPFGEGGLNAYGYCMENPANRTDPTGHFSIPMQKLLNPIAEAGRVFSSRMARVDRAISVVKKDFTSDLISQPLQLSSRINSLDYPNTGQFSYRRSTSPDSPRVSSASSSYAPSLSSRKSSFIDPTAKLGPRAPLPRGVKSKTEWSYPEPDYSHDNIYETLQPIDAHDLVSRSIYELDMKLSKENKILDLLTSPQAREIKNISAVINNIRLG